MKNEIHAIISETIYFLCLVFTTIYGFIVAFTNSKPGMIVFIILFIMLIFWSIIRKLMKKWNVIK